MNAFPRTTVGGVSLPRLIIGTNWFLGYSHCTPAKDKLIHRVVSGYKKMADVLEVFFNAGIDAIYGEIQDDMMRDAVREVEQRAGVRAIVISTPHFTVTPRTPFDGFDPREVDRILDEEKARGAMFCLPHSSTTDLMLDCAARQLRNMDELSAAIRERGMLPGLSTHRPESIIYADETGLDVETYVSIYNAMGFLMPVEVDWIASVIRRAKKPVITIKPMAAGQIRPFQAMNFVWNTLRPCDMVVAGTIAPDEARELIDLSLDILERRTADTPLQETRSKAPLNPRAAAG